MGLIVAKAVHLLQILRGLQYASGFKTRQGIRLFREKGK